jgi:hypothetical protein
MRVKLKHKTCDVSNTCKAFNKTIKGLALCHTQVGKG